MVVTEAGDTVPGVILSSGSTATVIQAGTARTKVISKTAEKVSVLFIEPPKVAQVMAQQNLAAVIATSSRGERGPPGPPGTESGLLGGIPVEVNTPTNYDVLQLVGGAWRNSGKELLTDGGNF